MRDDPATRAHDLRAALIRGYARRCRDHATLALQEADGWYRPDGDHRDREAGAGFAGALDALVEAALRAGVTRERLEQRLSLLVKNGAGFQARDDHDSLVENHWRNIDRSMKRRDEREGQQ